MGESERRWGEDEKIKDVPGRKRRGEGRKKKEGKKEDEKEGKKEEKVKNIKREHKVHMKLTLIM